MSYIINNMLTRVNYLEVEILRLRYSLRLIYPAQPSRRHVSPLFWTCQSPLLKQLDLLLNSYALINQRHAALSMRTNAQRIIQTNDVGDGDSITKRRLVNRSLDLDQLVLGYRASAREQLLKNGNGGFAG